MTQVAFAMRVGAGLIAAWHCVLHTVASMAHAIFPTPALVNLDITPTPVTSSVRVAHMVLAMMATQEADFAPATLGTSAVTVHLLAPVSMANAMMGARVMVCAAAATAGGWALTVTFKLWLSPCQQP